MKAHTEGGVTTQSASGPSELAILDHCDHLPHRERKEEVLRLAASFLEQRTVNR